MQHLVFLPALLGTFCFLGNTLFGQSGIDLGLFNTPANSDRLEVRIRPTQTITNGIYSAGIFTVRVQAAEKVQGYQFTISLQDLEVVDILPGTGMYLDNFGLFGDAITTSFDGDQPGGFEVTFRALAAGLLSTKLGVSSHITKAEAYRAAQERSDITFRFNQDTQPTEATAGFQLYQNLPNPFIERTNICFQLPEAAATTLTIFDAAGRIIWRHSADLRKGDHCFELEAAAFESTGLFYYQIKTPAHTAGRKMFFIR